jgi:E3 ubiquitin-protein ligase TRIP12
VEKRKDLFLDTTPEPANAALAEPATTAMMVDMMADVDEDAALAAALAMSAGDAGLDLAALGMGDIGGMGGMGDMGLGGMGQENLEEQLLACRCLANLMEAMPGSARTLVYRGAVPVLCSKLLQITFIELAEQNISVRPRPHFSISLN